MFGAIVGDVIGSVYEFKEIKTTEFPLFSRGSTFTDDTVLTLAIASALLRRADYAIALKELGNRYPDRGYGLAFSQWLTSRSTAAYGSWGNGSAMRVSPVGFAFTSAEEVLAEAERSAAVTHNHPEGIKGAQAVALAVFLAKSGKSKASIKQAIEDQFAYNLNRRLQEIRPTYRFNESCQGTVPEAIVAFLESTDYEGAVRNAISLGGDADTLACIAGGIAQAYYKDIPEHIVGTVRGKLPEELLAILDEFNSTYGL